MTGEAVNCTSTSPLLLWCIDNFVPEIRLVSIRQTVSNKVEERRLVRLKNGKRTGKRKSKQLAFILL